MTTNPLDRLSSLRDSPIAHQADARKRRRKQPIYTLDLETDPFKHGRFPHPFVCGIYDGDRFHSWWGPDCIEQSFQFLCKQPAGLIYAHNGGRFDILYYLKYVVGQKAMIINRRIVKIEMPCLDGIHEFRDSLAIFPFPLSTYKKDEFDYHLMEAEVRETHREAILKYLRNDCVNLHELVSGFVERFGPKLTIGSTAMGEIQSMHPFQTLTPAEDFAMRGGKGKDGKKQ